MIGRDLTHQVPGLFPSHHCASLGTQVYLQVLGTCMLVPHTLHPSNHLHTCADTHTHNFWKTQKLGILAKANLWWLGISTELCVSMISYSLLTLGLINSSILQVLDPARNLSSNWAPAIQLRLLSPLLHLWSTLTPQPLVRAMHDGKTFHQYLLPSPVFVMTPLLAVSSFPCPICQIGLPDIDRDQNLSWAWRWAQKYHKVNLTGSYLCS